MSSPRSITLFRAGGACTFVGILGLAILGPRSGQAIAMHVPVRANVTSHVASRVALAKIALSLQDVAAAFGGGFVTQLDTAGSNLFGSQFNSKVGRISGYTKGYMRQHPVPVMLNSGVNLFKNSGFASAAVQRVYTVYSNAQNRKDGVHVAHLRGLGDTGLILTYDLGMQKGMHFHELCVMFGQGAFAADVILVAGGSLDRTKLLSLANTMSSRIKQDRLTRQEER